MFHFLVVFLENACLFATQCDYVHEPQPHYARLWLAFVAQPKSTEVPDYPHNYHTIPMFVHQIALPWAIHWQHSFVQKTTKVCGASCIHR